MNAEGSLLVAKEGTDKIKRKFLLGLPVLTFIALVACTGTTPAPVLKTAIPTAVVVSPVPITTVPSATVPPTAMPSTPTVPPAAVPPTAVLPTPTVAPAVACQDQVTFKGEELSKDYAQFAPNAPIVKQWSIYNTGTCTWDSSYNWMFVSGDQNDPSKSEWQRLATSQGWLQVKYH